MIHSSRTLVMRALIAVLALAAFGAFTATAQAKPKTVKTKSPVAVYPIAGTKFVSNKTTISFRGLSPRKLKLNEIKVVGGKTGVHKGRKLRHSDGKGVSFVPKKDFAKGETIRVRTDLRIVGGKKGDFKYRVANLTTRDDKPSNPDVPPVTDGLHSRPDLKPERINVTTYGEGVSPGKIFFAPKQDGLGIADNRGRVTWWDPTNHPATGVTFLNFRTQQYNGKPVLTYWKGSSSVTGYSQIGSYEILNRKYENIASFTPGNGYKADIHEFQMTPRNTALVLSYVGVNQDLTSVGGLKNGRLLDNVVQEIDIKTGAVLFEWHSAGNVPFTTGIGQVPDDRTSFDYFHANSIQWDGDSYLVSSRRQSSIYRVDRKTGKIRWALSGTGNSRNDFEMGEGTEFGYQHDAQRLPNGDIQMFDNSFGRFEPPVFPGGSSALVLRLSGKKGNRKATLVHRFTYPGEGLKAASQGNAEPLENGNTFVGWGQINHMTEFNAAGDIVFDATHTGTVIPDLGVNSSYRTYKGNWTGIPQGKPAIAVDPAGTKVWASWNGSQSTTKWEVLSGPDVDSLSKVGESAWNDFETEIATSGLGAVTAVRAVDKNGKTLGQSKAVAVGSQDSGQK